MVKSRDPKSLAEGVVRVLSDPEHRRTLEVYALTRARERFSSETMVGNYRKIYEGLTAPRAGQSARQALGALN